MGYTKTILKNYNTLPSNHEVQDRELFLVDNIVYIQDGIKEAKRYGVYIWEGTQAEYDAITTPDTNTLYLIND